MLLATDHRTSLSLDEIGHPTMPTSPTNAEILAVLSTELGDVEHHDPATGEDGIDIYAFGRNFVDDCDEDAEDDIGYVLVTCGMSRRRLPPLPEGQHDTTRAVELIWYVKTLDPAYIANLRWLAELPRIDGIAYFHGRTVSMPTPPLASTPFKTFLLLPPIYEPDAELLSDMQTPDGDTVTTLVVHLVSDAERGLVTRDSDGLDDFLDMLDEREYPMLFDPARTSYV